MPKVQQISRRTWLARVALGSFAVWSELNFGFGRRGWGIAIGGSDLAIGVANAQNMEPAKPFGSTSALSTPTSSSAARRRRSSIPARPTMDQRSPTSFAPPAWIGMRFTM
jgi:hypothetical protein